MSKMTVENTYKSSPSFSPREAAAMVPFAVIWGVQWIVSSLIEYLGQWFNILWLEPYTVYTGLIVTVLWAIRAGVKGLPAGFLSATVLPVMLLAAAVWVLEYVQAVDPFFVPVFRSFILSLLLVVAGVQGIRVMAEMGLLLFVLTAIIALWFLGFSHLVLGGFGGLCLLGGGWMVKKYDSKK